MTCDICKRELDDNLSSCLKIKAIHTMYKYPKEINLCGGCTCWLYRDVIREEQKVYEAD